MPGIAGIISSKKPAHECQRVVTAMVGSMLHESFYVSDYHFSSRSGVYAGAVWHKGCLATLTTPLHKSESVALLLSGECFFDPATDGAAQSLIDLYRRQTSAFVSNLNGIFGGLLVDEAERSALLFNDRYGVERLYYYESDDAFYFASEAKALLRVLAELRTFDEEGIAQYLTFGCTIDNRTLFEGIRLVPGGSLWRFCGGQVNKQVYFRPETWQSLSALPARSFQLELNQTFDRVLARYFKSEAKVGISLTGGLDTRMIMSCLPDNAAELIAYTFTGFERETLDDSIAREVAKVVGIEHQLLRLNDEFIANFPSYADRTVYLTDGCFGVTGAHEIYFNQQARALSPVRVTGLFGSEILRGISTFKPGIPPAQLINSELNIIVDRVRREWRDYQLHPVTFAAFENVPWNLYGSMAASRSQVTLRTPFLDNEIVALAFQAPTELRTSAKPSLRLIKQNDPRLLSIPTDRGIGGCSGRATTRLKHLLLEGLFKLDYIYNEGMPSWGARFDPVIDAIDSRVRILGRHKFLHYRRWFTDKLSPYITEVLSDRQTQEMPFWNGRFLTSMAKAQSEGRGNFVGPISTVLTLEAVARLLLRGLPSSISMEPDVAPAAAVGETAMIRR